jgi:hypothetical protein
MLKQYFFLYYQTTYLNEEVSFTEPSHFGEGSLAFAIDKEHN